MEAFTGAKKREVAFQHNASAPVNRLSAELVADVFRHEFQELQSPHYDRWKRILCFLRVIGAVSSGWRQVRDDAAMLWSTIHHEHAFIEINKSAVALELLSIFLSRSKGALINLTLKFDRFEDAKDPISLLLPHLHRCHTFRFSGKHDAFVPLIFPLPLDACAIKILEYDLFGHPGGDSAPIFSEGNKIELNYLSIINSNRGIQIPLLKNLNPFSITSLNLGTELHRDVLLFAAECENLESLTMRALDDQYDSLREGNFDGVPVITLLRLTYLQIDASFPYDFPYVLNCPRLLFLRISSKLRAPLLIFPARRLFSFPQLRALSIRESKVDIIRCPTQFINSHGQLRALTLMFYPQLLVPILRSLALSKEMDGSDISIPCPNLKYIRIRDWHYEWHPDYADAAVTALSLLLRSRSALRVEWVGCPPAHILDPLSALFGERFTYLTKCGSETRKDLEELSS